MVYNNVKSWPHIVSPYVNITLSSGLLREEGEESFVHLVLTTCAYAAIFIINN